MMSYQQAQQFDLTAFEPVVGYELALQAEVASLANCQLLVRFTLHDPDNRVEWPEGAPFPVSQDFLWNQTCFEVFIRPNGVQAYTELNITPRNHWAAYGFTSYRTPAQMPPPRESRVRLVHSEIRRHQLSAVFDLSRIYTPAHLLNIGLCAVLTHPPHQFKTYWSIQHSATSEPDFHRTACWLSRIQLIA